MCGINCSPGMGPCSAGSASSEPMKEEDVLVIVPRAGAVCWCRTATAIRKRTPAVNIATLTAIADTIVSVASTFKGNWNRTDSLMAKPSLAFAVDHGSDGVGVDAQSQTIDKGFARVPIRRFPRLFSWIAGCLTCAASITAPQVTRGAECVALALANGGLIQNGGAPCTVGPITVGYGTAITATNSADVTANGAVTAHGFGTGISAATNSIVTANGPVTASGLGLGAASGSTIFANNILLSNDGGGGAVAMSANNATITANGIAVNWSSGGGQSLVQALAAGLIQFAAPSTISNAFGGVPSILLARDAGSRIVADNLSISTGSSGGIAAAKAEAGGTINLRSGNSITFAAGGGGNTGLWAAGAGSQILSTGTILSMPGGGGGDTGVRADTSGAITLNQGSVAVLGNGGGEIRPVGAKRRKHNRGNRRRGHGLRRRQRRWRQGTRRRGHHVEWGKRLGAKWQGRRNRTAGKRSRQHTHGGRRYGDRSGQQQWPRRSGSILRQDLPGWGQRQHRRRFGYRAACYRNRQFHCRRGDHDQYQRKRRRRGSGRHAGALRSLPARPSPRQAPRPMACATGTNSSITATDINVTTMGSTAHAAAVTSGATLP